MTSIRLTLLLILCFSFSCNQVKELQEPDPFATAADLPFIKIQSFADSVEINVLQSNNINVPVSLNFEKPAHGIVVKKKDTQQFFYIPDRSFFGKDSILYQMCRESSCRRGRIDIEKQRNPSRCYPVYSSPDTAVMNISAGPGRKAIPLFPGDMYCNGNVRAMLSGSFAGMKNFSISDSIRFNCNFARRQKRSFLISYSNTDQYLGTKNRHVRLNLVPETKYCDDIFEVGDREFPLEMERGDSLRISFSTFLGLVEACDGDLDTSFFQPAVTPNLLLKSLGNKRFVFFVKPMSPPGPARVIYRYRNIRGISDAGELRILIHHK